jgi:hypothetical protein
MLLSLLNRKEKLKFLDLAIHMVSVDGEPTSFEKRILNMMLAEVGDDIYKEYTFKLANDKDFTIDFFVSTPKTTRHIVLLNLLKLSMFDDLYNTEEHFFIDTCRRRFKIGVAKRKELMRIIYAERDWHEQAKRVVME